MKHVLLNGIHSIHYMRIMFVLMHKLLAEMVKRGMLVQHGKLFMIMDSNTAITLIHLKHIHIVVREIIQFIKK